MTGWQATGGGVPEQDAAAANANMCALLEEEAAEKERELREAAKRAKRKAKKARARLQRLEEEEACAVSAASDPNEAHAEPAEVRVYSVKGVLRSLSVKWGDGVTVNHCQHDPACGAMQASNPSTNAFRLMLLPYAGAC